MSHYNPMLEKLQRQLQDYNRDTEAKIDQVANRQNLITLAFVVFNIIVFLVLESTLGGKAPVLLDIPNTVLNFVATLILLLVSFPLASGYAKRNLQKLQLNEENIDASLNYAGIWEYETNFHVESHDDGSKTYNIYLGSDYDLSGVCFIVLNGGAGQVNFILENGADVRFDTDNCNWDGFTMGMVSVSSSGYSSPSAMYTAIANGTIKPSKTCCHPLFVRAGSCHCLLRKRHAGCSISC